MNESGATCPAAGVINGGFWYSAGFGLDWHGIEYQNPCTESKYQ